jgi:hypothetical protein
MDQGSNAITERLAAYSAVATSLALCSDRTLSELIDAASPLGTGIGGRSVRLDADGTPVFVKLVPLTALELRPGLTRSTANVFGLPAYCHYGLGSPGFGAWRELAVHTMTTNWVLAGQFHGFPLMYHWRVLPGPAPALPEELADVERAVARWGGRDEVGARIQALAQSTASIALFLEYFPDNLNQWLGTRMKAGDDAADRACAMVEAELAAGVSFMNARGLLHFDGHFNNILTDGQRLYFADYGLALSSRFELSADEAAFAARHRTYDRCYTVTHLVRWLVTAVHGCGWDELDAPVRAYARGEQPAGIPAAAATILLRYAPVAAVMGEFYRQLQQESLETPYPLEKLRQVSTETARPG